ncbi:hypothetical protein BMS3Abin06_01529 [bacterium BMS3Abin06]|nr:hypothetical protein BMS3Abin06_01529 [bacterium BMS3Abin06]
MREIRKVENIESIYKKVTNLFYDESIAKKVTIYASHRFNGSPLREIGAYFGFGESAVSFYISWQACLSIRNQHFVRVIISNSLPNLTLHCRYSMSISDASISILWLSAFQAAYSIFPAFLISPSRVSGSAARKSSDEYPTGSIIDRYFENAFASSS